MNQLSIADLEFCETSDNSEVKGGLLEELLGLRELILAQVFGSNPDKKENTPPVVTKSVSVMYSSNGQPATVYTSNS
jgi:hypothetical protein